MATLPLYDIKIDENAMKKQMESTSRFIGVVQWISFILALLVCILLLVVLLISINFPSERKLISGTVLGVLIILTAIGLFIVRSDPNLSIIFSSMLLFVSGIGLGVSIQYI